MKDNSIVRNRIIWVDSLRGLLIILMVAGHASSPYNTYIYTFHVAAFFILSGYTHSLDRNNALISIKKKVLTLLIPYYLLNILFFSVYSISFRSGIHSLLFGTLQPIRFVERALIFLKSPQSTTGLAGPMWFLFVLFIAEFIFGLLQFIMQKIKGPKDLEIFFGFLIGVFGLAIMNRPPFSQWALDLGLHALIYYSIGLALHRWNVFDHLDNNFLLPFVIILVVFFGTFYSWEGAAMNWPTRRFVALPQEILMVISAFILVRYVILLLSECTVINNLLLFIGRRTFSILVFHFLAFKLISVGLASLGFVDYGVVINDVPIGLSGYWWLLYTIVGIGLCVFVSKVSERQPILNYLVNANI